tara:strand:+ start:232 stop:447 length:216 start_codon:yes stop_codon:yes gene_type:complete
MAEEKRYKVLELSTQGWSLIENNAQNLTSAQADAKIQESLDSGVAPNRLKIVVQNDPRYPTDVDPGWFPTD